MITVLSFCGKNFLKTLSLITLSIKTKIMILWILIYFLLI